MMRKNLTWIVGVAMLCTAGTALAEPTDMATLEKKIESLTTQVEALRVEQEKTRQQDRIAKALENIAAEEAASGLPKWLQDLDFFADFRLRFEKMIRDSRAIQWATVSAHLASVSGYALCHVLFAAAVLNSREVHG